MQTSTDETTAEEGTAVAAATAAGKVSEHGSSKVVVQRDSSFRRALGPTMCCVYALLVLKTAQQAFVDSLPLFTVGLGVHA